MVDAPANGDTLGAADMLLEMVQVYGPTPPMTLSVLEVKVVVEKATFGTIVMTAAVTVTLDVANPPAESTTLTTSVPVSLPAVYPPELVMTPPEALVLISQLYGGVPFEAVKARAPEVFAAAGDGVIDTAMRASRTVATVSTGAGAG